MFILVNLGNRLKHVKNTSERLNCFQNDYTMANKCLIKINNNFYSLSFFHQLPYFILFYTFFHSLINDTIS